MKLDLKIGQKWSTIASVSVLVDTIPDTNLNNRYDDNDTIMCKLNKDSSQIIAVRLYELVECLSEPEEEDDTVKLIIHGDEYSIEKKSNELTKIKNKEKTEIVWVIPNDKDSLNRPTVYVSDNGEDWEYDILCGVNHYNFEGPFICRKGSHTYCVMNQVFRFREDQ